MARIHQSTAVRFLEIDAGHRVEGHEGKCANLHGHRYKFAIHAQAEQLDNIGRVIDFGKIKEIVGGWLDEHWDHGMIIWEKDPYAYLWEEPAMMGCDGGFHEQKHYFLPANPTAENMAAYLHDKANQLLEEYGIKVVKVECWETPNCLAIAEL